MKADFLKILSRTAFGLLGIMALTLAAATVVETRCGTAATARTIYGSLWFVGLWGLLFLAGGWLCLRSGLFQRPAPFLLHAAFGVILLGACVTRFSAERGTLHLRQGEIERSYADDETGQTRPLPFAVKLLLFDIEYHPGTAEPADFISFLKIDDEVCRVSMNRIRREQGYRLLQAAYDPDEMGSILMVNHDPWGIGITYAGYLLLGIAMIVLLLQRIGWRGAAATALPTAALWYYISQVNPMTPVLRSPMLAAHVSVIMMAYLLLAVIALLSAAALVAPRRALLLDRWNRKLLYPAVFLLAAGIFIGAVWANISWGRYWGWDPKEVWALITLMIYAVPFHTASLAGMRRPRTRHIYCLAALLAVAMTYYGVNHLLGGIHSYM